VHALGQGCEAESVDEPHLLDHLFEPHSHVLALRKLPADHQSELYVVRHQGPPGDSSGSLLDGNGAISVQSQKKMHYARSGAASGATSATTLCS
jgi:hypothetical protein